MMRHLLTLALLAVLMVGGSGCAGSDDDPTAAPGSGGSMTTNLYDGVWDTDFGPFDYPVRGATLDVVDDTLVHLNSTTFWDLQQCTGTYQSRFDPIPPESIQGGRVAVQGLQDGSIKLVGLDVTFQSPTTATGTLVVAIDQGGAPCSWQTLPLSFTAVRR